MKSFCRTRTAEVKQESPFSWCCCGPLGRGTMHQHPKIALANPLGLDAPPTCCLPRTSSSRARAPARARAATASVRAEKLASAPAALAAAKDGARDERGSSWPDLENQLQCGRVVPLPVLACFRGFTLFAEDPSVQIRIFPRVNTASIFLCPFARRRKRARAPMWWAEPRAAFGRKRWKREET